MVLINGLKYACERCIRGHRVTTCSHTDQPLMMIKPKGRPSTTCAHCKELKKNRNSHPSGVCTCGREEKRRLLKKAKEDARAKVQEERCRCNNKADCVCHKIRQKKQTSRRAGGLGSGADALIAGENSHLDSFLDDGGMLLTMGALGVGEVGVNGDGSPLLTKQGQFVNSSSQNIVGEVKGYLAGDSASSPQRSDAVLENKTPLGLDALQSVNPLTPLMCTHVGEVSIPLNEYVPSVDSGIPLTNPLLNLNDRISFQESPAKEKMNFFTDTSKSQMNYNELKQRRQKMPTEPSAQQLASEATGMVSSNSLWSVSSTETASPMAPSSTSASFLGGFNSSDSISSLLTMGEGSNNYAHYYQDMLHHSSIQNPSSSLVQSPSVTGAYSAVKQGPECKSCTSVETPFSLQNSVGPSLEGYPLLSCTHRERKNAPTASSELNGPTSFPLAPSFLDLPDSVYKVPFSVSSPHKTAGKKNSNSVVSHQRAKLWPRQRSVSVHKNHRYDQYPATVPTPLKSAPVNTSSTVVETAKNDVSVLEEFDLTSAFGVQTYGTSEGNVDLPSSQSHEALVLGPLVCDGLEQNLSDSKSLPDVRLPATTDSPWPADDNLQIIHTSVFAATLQNDKCERNQAPFPSNLASSAIAFRSGEDEYKDLDNIITSL